MKAKKIILVVVFGLAIGAGVVYEHHRVAKLREYSNNMELLVGAQLNTTIVLRPDSTILLNIFGQLFKVPIQSIK